MLSGAPMLTVSVGAARVIVGMTLSTIIKKLPERQPECPQNDSNSQNYFCGYMDVRGTSRSFSIDTFGHV